MYISLEDAASTVEGRPASIRLTLNIANGGELECGGIWIEFSRSDITTSKPMQSFYCELLCMFCHSILLAIKDVFVTFNWRMVSQQLQSETERTSSMIKTKIPIVLLQA